MPTQLKLITRQGVPIVIELLDNPFITDFVRHFKKNLALFNISSQKMSIPPSVGSFSQERINQLEQDFIDSINALNAIGVNFPIAVEEIYLSIDSYGRDLLNRLHRHFTTSLRSVSHSESKFIWQDETDLIFTLSDANRAEFVKQVHKINDTVHTAEIMYGNERKTNFPRYHEYNVSFDSWSPKDPNNNVQVGFFTKIKDEHKQYFSNELKYDVWLPLHQILGKNYWAAYFDEDDPTHWDIDINVAYTGSFAITDRAAIKDPAIVNWLKSYGITPGPEHCGMPLGNIIKGQEIVTKLVHNDILDIVLYE